MSIIVKSGTREEREKDFKDVKNYKKRWKRIKKKRDEISQQIYNKSDQQILYINV
jgi:hypothetical protein